jgi:hypothetical protein
MARIACPSCASNLQQRHRAMCGALNRSAQRTPVDGHLTCVCCSYPSQPQRARRLADSAHGVVGEQRELTPTSRQWGATPFGSALQFRVSNNMAAAAALHAGRRSRGWCCMRWRYLQLSCFCGVRPIVIGLPAMQQHSCARRHKRHYLTCIVAHDMV